MRQYDLENKYEDNSFYSDNAFVRYYIRRLDHIAEMYRLKGGGNIHGDMQPRSESRLAILSNTTHVTLMNRMTTIVPMINDFLNAKPLHK